jgi:hypothetical protein
MKLIMVTARGCPCRTITVVLWRHDSQSDLAAEQGLWLLWRKVEEMVGAVQRLPVLRSSEYPAFRRGHWVMGRPSSR